MKFRVVRRGESVVVQKEILDHTTMEYVWSNVKGFKHEGTAIIFCKNAYRKATSGTIFEIGDRD